ncbi:MAG: YqgE/AlgH family protein [Bryobacteraceae bacterium]
MKLAWLLALAVTAHAADLATGALLVATTKSHDPDFAHSVIVLIHYDSQSAIGLMLNKPTDLPISDFLPEAKGRQVVVYAGGPLAIGVRGLLRTKSAPFFSVITNKPELLKRIASGAPSNSFRIYAGYVGWTARQLQNEVARGLWTLLSANGGEVFDPHPETLWDELLSPRLTPSRPIR